MKSHTFRFHVGVDENGLGALLGPLIVTAVTAEVSEAGQLFLKKRLSRSLRKDLDDSKKLVAFGKHELGEAWARALHPTASNPDALLAEVLRLPTSELQERCPHLEYAAVLERPRLDLRRRRTPRQALAQETRDD